MAPYRLFLECAHRVDYVPIRSEWTSVVWLHVAAAANEMMSGCFEGGQRWNILHPSVTSAH